MVLYVLGLVSVLYGALAWKKGDISPEVSVVILLAGAYLTYSYIWSVATILYVRTNLYGATSNFTYAVESVSSAYAITLSGLSVALATCVFLSRRSFVTGYMGRTRICRIEAKTAFWCALLISMYALVSLARLVFQSSYADTDVRSLQGDVIGYICQHIFGLPLAVAMKSGNRRHVLVAGGVVLLTAAIGLFSGRTTFVAVGMAPVLVVYIAENVKDWKGILRALAGVILSLLVLQGYRTVRALRSGATSNKSLAIQNSFSEILTFSRVEEKVGLRESYLGLGPIMAALYEFVPGSIGGADKDAYLRQKTDVYVAERFFRSPSRMPITIYGDGFLIGGIAGVIAVAIIVGAVLSLSQVVFQLELGGRAAGLIAISAVVYSTRMGVAELLVTLVAGFAFLWSVSFIGSLIWPQRIPNAVL